MISIKKFVQFNKADDALSVREDHERVKLQL